MSGGSGRGATLPAWMTSGDSNTSAPEEAVSISTINSSEINDNSNPKFADLQVDTQPSTSNITLIKEPPIFKPVPSAPMMPPVIPSPVAAAPMMTAPTLSLAPTLQTTGFLPFRPPPAGRPAAFQPVPVLPMVPPLHLPAPSMQMQMPTPMPMPVMPMSIPLPTPAPVPSGVSDPNNDASLWKEHVNELDDRKYWFNRVTLVSTYEKPFCLKTPEERSIPPCVWKEYTTTTTENGVTVKKKYYSNGTESL